MKKTTTIILLLFIISFEVAHAQQGKKMNILFIFTD